MIAQYIIDIYAFQIRVWNYVNGRCDLARKFYVGEEAHSTDINPLLGVAIHPNGYYLAAGFIDKIRYYKYIN